MILNKLVKGGGTKKYVFSERKTNAYFLRTFLGGRPEDPVFPDGEMVIECDRTPSEISSTETDFPYLLSVWFSAHNNTGNPCARYCQVNSDGSTSFDGNVNSARSLFVNAGEAYTVASTKPFNLGGGAS